MAFCIAQRRYSDFFTSVESAAIERRIPYTGALELTYRCNLNCCHCYCNLGLNDKRKSDELTAREIKRIIDEAVDAGCLWLLLTGGEILVREDFRDIYLYAVKKGMFTEVFTNATLIDDKTAELFTEFRPFGIDISIYGSTPETHDKITRVNGSFKKAMDGISMLKKHEIGFSLKTILMNLNRADLEGMQKLAANLGAEFHYDTVITPRIDGGLSPAKYRLSAETMAAFDLDRDPEGCRDMFTHFWNKGPDETISCGAGIFSFNINPYGYLE
jgi:MoaA/NifB/PqqE/SkfB family radical SAM enzyme